jgi:hypothetical protein
MTTSTIDVGKQPPKSAKLSPVFKMAVFSMSKNGGWVAGVATL